MAIEELKQTTLKFKDYQKAKKELEFERHKQVANYKGPAPMDGRRKSGQLTMIEEEEPDFAPPATKSLKDKKDE